MWKVNDGTFHILPFYITMLSQVKIQRYKSLHNVTVDLEPLTVLIGPNNSGKSNFCEALFVMSHLLKWRGKYDEQFVEVAVSRILEGAARLPKYQNWSDKFWRRQTDMMAFGLSCDEDMDTISYEITLPSKARQVPPQILKAIDRVAIYQFSTALMSQEGKPTSLAPTGEGIGNALAAIKLEHPSRFEHLEQTLSELMPKLSHILLQEQSKFHKTYHELSLVDKYSNQPIPASEVSDGSLRVLAFLTALYQVETPTIFCFEELENGLHPWLLSRLVEILQRVTSEGVADHRAQVIVTTHSPVMLDYFEPHQVRAVEFDTEGKTRMHALPTQVSRLQAALEAYDNELGEMWFTNLFGDARSDR